MVTPTCPSSCRRYKEVRKKEEFRNADDGRKPQAREYVHQFKEVVDCRLACETVKAKDQRYYEDSTAENRVVEHKEDKVLHVSHAHTVVDPWTVVVHLENTAIANSRTQSGCSNALAVMALHWFVGIAHSTP